MTTHLRNPSPTVIAPPFTLETATRKVRLAEDAWNSRDPERVALAYTEDSQWRNRSEFVVGRDQIRQFLARKWARELDYRLVKALWAFSDDRIGVRFQYRQYGPPHCPTCGGESRDDPRADIAFNVKPDLYLDS